MTGEPSPETESGLPAKQGEFTISFPWPARLVLTATIGATVGFAASAIFAPNVGVPSAGSMMIAAGAIAATLLSIRKVHGWHVSTFADGTIAGLAAGPIFALLMIIRAAFQPGAHVTLGAAGQGLLLALWFAFIGVVVIVPCGWMAGFAYHLALSAAERARADEDDSA